RADFSSFAGIPRPPLSPLFPYTTLFRSVPARPCGERLADIPRVVLHREDEDLGLGPLAKERRDHLETVAVGHHDVHQDHVRLQGDRKSTRLNSSHVAISYAVFCLKKKIC